MTRRIAYVEDDDIIRENYAEILREEGFEVSPFATKESAMSAFAQSLPDLALLDVSLHGERDAGYQICLELRRMSAELPIIFLTSHDGEVDRISGLRMGADDYLTKDSTIDYIVVRIETLFRRLDAIRSAAEEKKNTNPVPDSKVSLDDLYSRASWQGTRLELPLTLYWILKDLVTHPGIVRSHRDLMRAANIVVEQNTITAHVKSLRTAFKDVDAAFDAIKTERGRGYRWVD
ncbi:MAG: response regulator transcription factor [Pseudomonadota bacterium]